MTVKVKKHKAITTLHASHSSISHFLLKLAFITISPTLWCLRGPDLIRRPLTRRPLPPRNQFSLDVGNKRGQPRQQAADMAGGQ